MNVLYISIGSPFIVFATLLGGVITRRKWTPRFSQFIEGLWVFLSAVSLCVGAELFVLSADGQSLRQTELETREAIFNYKIYLNDARDVVHCNESTFSKAYIRQEGDYSPQPICNLFSDEIDRANEILGQPSALYEGRPILPPVLSHWRKNNDECRTISVRLPDGVTSLETSRMKTIQDAWMTYCEDIRSLQIPPAYNNSWADNFLTPLQSRLPYWFFFYAAIAGLRCARIFVPPIAAATCNEPQSTAR